MTAFRKGSRVQWKWAGGFISGKVKQTFKESVSVTIKGKKITRHGSTDNPAYLIAMDDGREVLKLKSELSVANAKGADWAKESSLFR